MPVAAPKLGWLSALVVNKSALALGLAMRARQPARRHLPEAELLDYANILTKTG
jgi:hypothetical protein